MLRAADVRNQSKFLELPRLFVLKQELQDAVKKARIACSENSSRSQEWDIVDMQAKKTSKTAFEEYREEFSEQIDWCMYDALYSV